MYMLLNLLIFVITLFFYIHIYYHIKKSNYLEVYEVENISKDKFEELCDMKQPILINNIELNNDLNLDYLLLNYPNFEIKIKNKETNSIPLPINLIEANELFKKDISSNYFSEYNNEFIEETSLEKYLCTTDNFLKPYFISNKNYDIILGSKNSYNKLKSQLNLRNMFYINEGSIELTLCTPKDYKYLHVEEDHENLEYYSMIDIYKVNDKYKKDFDKIKLLRLNINKGQLIQIPPYWFYSIKILEENTIITNYKYRTYMNCLAISPQLFIKFLQDNNIKRNFTKIISI